MEIGEIIILLLFFAAIVATVAVSIIITVESKARTTPPPKPTPTAMPAPGTASVPTPAARSAPGTASIPTPAARPMPISASQAPKNAGYTTAVAYMGESLYQCSVMPAIIKCRYCNGENSKEADACEICGKSLKKEK